MQKKITYFNGERTLNLLSAPFKLLSIEGISPSSTINSSSIAGFDGSTYISEQTEKRAITLSIGFRGASDHESDKYSLYDTFKLKKEGILRYTGNDRDLSIKCRVTAVNIPPNAFPFVAQVLLECADPYFYADELVSYIATTVGAFEFPFECEDDIEFGIMTDSLVASVENNGEIPTGCLFTLTAIGNVLNPKIQNMNTFEWMQINVSMSTDDKLIINTYRGQKSITFIHNNVAQNYINHKVYGSTFLQLAVGTNTFVYSADENEENLEISCTFSEKYGGV